MKSFEEQHKRHRDVTVTAKDYPPEVAGPPPKAPVKSGGTPTARSGKNTLGRGNLGIKRTWTLSGSSDDEPYLVVLDEEKLREEGHPGRARPLPKHLEPPESPSSSETQRARSWRPFTHRHGLRLI